MVTLLDKVVMTDYGQLDITWSEDGGFDGDVDRFFAGQVNGLVGATDSSGVYVILARRSGGCPVRIELLEAEPGPPEASWEDIVEVSVTVPAGSSVTWSAWAGMDSGDLALPAGSYRLRVSAEGRDAGHALGDGPGTADRYLLELWPAPAAPDHIVRVGSKDAANWHREWGGRR
jgi:hypothetical protein